MKLTREELILAIMNDPNATDREKATIELLEDAELEVADAQSQNDSLNNHNTIVENRCGDLQDEVRKLTRDLNDANERIEELEVTLGDAETEIEQLEKLFKELEI